MAVVDDMNGRRVAILGVPATSAPVTFARRLRKLPYDWTSSQHIDLRFLPNFSLTRSFSRIASPIELLPMPPGPMSAIGLPASTSSINLVKSSPRPTRFLGAGGGDSPGSL